MIGQKPSQLIQARSQWGGGACNAPSTDLSVPTSNLQNIKYKHADQPAKKRATRYLIYVLPLLNRRGWTQHIFITVCICNMFCAML